MTRHQEPIGNPGEPPAGARESSGQSWRQRVRRRWSSRFGRREPANGRTAGPAWRSGSAGSATASAARGVGAPGALGALGTPGAPGAPGPVDASTVRGVSGATLSAAGVEAAAFDVATAESSESVRGAASTTAAASPELADAVPSGAGAPGPAGSGEAGRRRLQWVGWISRGVIHVDRVR